MSEDGLLAAGAAGVSYFAAERDLHESPRHVNLDRPTDAAVAKRNAPPAGGSRSNKRPVPEHADPARVLAAFNTWSFKREQPTDLQLMLRFIAEAIGVGDPIPFLLYWGKGPRNSIAPPDLACLDYLAAFLHRIERAYEPGAALRLIFTDTHAQLNGHSPSSRRRYFGEIEDAARQRGFDSCWLGALTHAADLGSAGLADAEVPPDMIKLLAASAMKWYRGEGTCEQGAAKYYRMNMVERRAVELAFPRSIFITFNGSKLRDLFPVRLPIFHMYSLRRGVAVKPWFLPAEIAQADGAPLPGAMPQLHEV
jgi:hypothetical protein